MWVGEWYFGSYHLLEELALSNYGKEHLENRHKLLFIDLESHVLDHLQDGEGEEPPGWAG